MIDVKKALLGPEDPSLVTDNCCLGISQKILPTNPHFFTGIAGFKEGAHRE
jgi:hypothetical protein